MDKNIYVGIFVLFESATIAIERESDEFALLLNSFFSRFFH